MSEKALIAMSGGVDSSVAAYFMKQAGYDCIGVTMKLFHNEDAGVSRAKSCCSLDDVEDARSVAHRLGIPYYVFNFTADFREQVMQRFVCAYESGATPNPCIDCNRYLKFDRLYHRARLLGCDCVVTGHYARIRRENGRFLLQKALDPSKDQSYVLYALTQDELAHTQLPLGGLSKAETRRIAQEQGFFNGPVDHLTAMPVLLDYVRGHLPLENTTIVSPDAGRIKVSEQWAAKLGGLPLAFIHKTRDTTRPNCAEAHGIIGDVAGRDCVVVDDMIDTAGTICEAVRTLNNAGAASVTLVATHGLLSGPAVERLSQCGAREIVLMDTVPVPEEKRLPNMTVLSVAPLLAAGIRSVFESGSVSTLLNGLPEDMRPRNIYA